MTALVVVLRIDAEGGVQLAQLEDAEPERCGRCGAAAAAGGPGPLEHHPVEVRTDPHSGRHYAHCSPCSWCSPSFLAEADAAAAGECHAIDQLAGPGQEEAPDG